METVEEFEKQCGSIFILPTGCMTFHCTLCENKFKGYDDFAVHVNEAHVNDYTIKEEVMEDSLQNEHENESILPMAMSSRNESEEKSNYDSEVDESAVTFELLLLEQNDGVENAINESIEHVDTPKEKPMNRQKVNKKPKEILPRRPRNVDTNAVATKTKTQFPCPECDYSTNIKVKLVEHVRRHFGDRRYSCDFCEQRFYTQNEKTRHTARHHADKVEPKKPTKEKLELRELIKSSLVDLGNNLYECKICNFSAEGRSSIWYHIRRHSTYKPYECTTCSKNFFTSNELNTHIRSHTGEKPYLCTECGNAYSTSSKLNIHLKRHNNIRDKECPFCKRRFFNKRQLESHMAVHSDDRPYACEICAATFKRQKTLSSHMRTHGYGRPYQCEICDVGFNQKASLLNHIKRKHTLENKDYITIIDDDDPYAD